MAGGTPSFSYLVFGKAVASTARFFGHSWKRDLLLGLVSLGVGFGLYWRFQGLPIAMEQVASVIAFTLAPLGAVVIVVFIWNLWLAPAELAYEAARAAWSIPAKLDVPPVLYEKPINWAIWKHKEAYNLKELSAILAKTDPGHNDGKDPDRTAYLKLLQEEGMAGRIQLTRSRLAEGYEKPDLWPDHFNMTKANAIAWAKAKGFDLSHIA